MSEASRDLIRQYFSCLSRHDVESAAALLAPGWRNHGLARTPLQLESWTKTLEVLFEGFPDAHFILQDTVVEGDRVAVRYTFAGTHLAAFCGMPPTERRVQVEGALVAVVDEGQIQQEWVNADVLGLLRQLGVIPEPA